MEEAAAVVVEEVFAMVAGVEPCGGYLLCGEQGGELAQYGIGVA